MKRDLKKSIAEYKKQFYGKDNGTGAFYASDLQQIAEMSSGKWELINNALTAGFMVGFRCAQRLEKNKKVPV